MKLPIAAFFICGVAMPAIADPFEYDNKYSHVTVVRGNPERYSIQTEAPLQEDIRINGWAPDGGPDCGTIVDSRTDYRIVTPPDHGMICFRREKGITKRSTGDPSCIGHEVMMLTVYYRPTGAYVGVDRFSYDTLLDGRIESVDAAEITILPPIAPLLKTDGAQEQESSGPMPRCPDDQT